jgi:hypothetical protein
MGGMALSDKETRILINYVRWKFAEERWPLSPALMVAVALLGITAAARWFWR